MPARGAALQRFIKTHSACFLACALAGAAALCVGGGMGIGCGAIDCSETATCPGQTMDATSEGQEGGSPTEEAQGESDASGANTLDIEADVDGTIEAGSDEVPDTTADATGEATGDAGPTLDASDDSESGPCTCVPGLPSGWNGPVAVFERSNDGGPSTAPSCPPTYPTLLFNANANPLVPSTSCQCTCEGPCTLQVSTYTNTNCGSPRLCATTTVSKSCAPGAGACAVQTAKITTPIAFTGCRAGVQRNIPAYAWGTTARACVNGGATYVQGSCEAGEVCVDTPPSTFGRGLCIYQSGSRSCPTAGYTLSRTYYGDAGDSRDCDASACQCTGPTSGTCGATNVTISSAADCSSGAALGGSCGTPFPVTSTPYIGATITSSGGSCMQAGTSSPVGAVMQNTPTTVCCTN